MKQIYYLTNQKIGKFLFIASFSFCCHANAQVGREWATYYGGTLTDECHKMAVDASGNVYVVGRTYSSNDIASGGHQNTISGTPDAFLVKFDASGNRIWATYYGGPGGDLALAVAVDASGNVYLAGGTTSTSGITSGGFQNSYGGGPDDAFLVKFNSAGVRQWATYYGGSGDEAGRDLAIDASGNIYMTGFTTSTTGIASGGHQNTYGGGTRDGFVVKFNSSGGRIWASYYGGSLEDELYSIRTDAVGNVFLGGFTSSTSSISVGGFQSTYGGGSYDAFLVKLSSAGVRQWSTYFGASGLEWGHGLSIDLNGNVYLSGSTTSTAGIASGGYQLVYGGGSSDHFLAKFSTTGSLSWSTYYGGPDNENMGNTSSCCTDPSNNVYLIASTVSLTGIASGGFQNTNSGTQDAYISKFDENGNFILATYYGSTQSDLFTSGACSPNGSIYGCGRTTSTTGISSNGFQNTYGGGSTDVFVVKFDSCTTIPATPGSITGSTSICSGSNNTYSVAAVSGATSYTWTLPSGWSGSSTTNSISITANSTSGNITVTATNPCGTSSAQTLAITVNTIPSTPGSISGTTSICSGSNNNYSITAVPGATSYTWTLPSGWSGTSTTNSITSTASATSGNINVTADNSCGSSSSSSLAITVTSSAPSTPGTISGTASICSGSSNTYSVTAVAGATSYTWTLPSGWSGTSTTNSISTTASSTSGNITVTANNVCGSSSASTQAITVNTIPSTPGSISGTSTICSGSNNTFSIAAVSGATSYTWTLPSGWSGTSTTNSISTTAGATSGNITVTATNVCGTSSSATLAVTVNTSPSTPGTISGTSTICSGSSNTYSITVVPNATSYTWTLPSGWSGTSTTNSITTTASATSGNITVTADNSCGSSAAASLTIAVNTIPATPGTISGANPICAGSTSNYSVSTVSGATSYTWTLPSGWSGTSTTNSISTTANSTSGNITVTANNGCGNSTASTLSIVVNPLPIVTFNLPTDMLCEYNSPLVLSGGTPSGGIYSGTGVSSGNFDPAITGTGIYQINYTFTDGNSCTNTASDNMTVDACLGVDEKSNDLFSVYPNPTNGILNIVSTHPAGTIKIYNAIGEFIYTSQLSSQNTVIEIREFESGIYFIQLINIDNLIATKRIIKE